MPRKEQEQKKVNAGKKEIGLQKKDAIGGQKEKTKVKLTSK